MELFGLSNHFYILSLVFVFEEEGEEEEEKEEEEEEDQIAPSLREKDVMR